MTHTQQMKRVCANCGMRYGKHQLVGDYCPIRGKFHSYRTTTFKLKRKKA